MDVDQIELKHRVTYLEHKRKNSRSRSKNNNADPNSGAHEGYYPVTVQTVQAQEMAGQMQAQRYAAQSEITNPGKKVQSQQEFTNSTRNGSTNTKIATKSEKPQLKKVEVQESIKEQKQAQRPQKVPSSKAEAIQGYINSDIGPNPTNGNPRSVGTP